MNTLGRTETPLLRRMRNSLEYRTGIHVKRRRFPSSVEQLRSSQLFNSWWYYSVELLPGLMTTGIYPESLPMLPRSMLGRCNLEGASCLDIGTMEGLMPVLMRRGGAKQVLAVDALGHCREKLEAVQHYYGVDFDYKNVGSMYDLDKKLSGQGFDLINCSGLLYHVFSPLMVLCGVRPLLKRNGLIIVSTGVVADDTYTMEFNDAGRLQTEPNTFWYISVPLFDYLLRYLKLAPVDCLFLPHAAMKSDVRYYYGKNSGYLSVLCRAVDEALPTQDDQWMKESVRNSWEYQWMIDWARAARQSLSEIKDKSQAARLFRRPDLDCIDLREAVKKGNSVSLAESLSDTHYLKLSDQF